MSAASGRAAGGLVPAAVAAACWLGVTLANGPAEGNDTAAYLRVADGLASGRLVDSVRLPGYPLFVAGVRGLAARMGFDGLTAVAVVQTLCLAGLGTWLVTDLGRRLTGWGPAGVVAGALYAADADLQQFGATVLTEALTVTLALAALWLRVRDGTWRWGGWLLAMLALVRPNYAVFPLAFAALEALRRRRLRAGLEPLLPAVVVVLGWWGVVAAGGGDPLRPYRWFVPVHTFGTVYEAGLWQALPEGPERALLAGLRARGVDPYQAAAAVERALGPGGVTRVARTAIRADPLGYAWARARLLRQVFRQGSWMRREIVRPAHPRPALLAALGRWRDAYQGLLYASFPLFVALLAGACWRGLGWPAATAPFRHVLGPFVAVLFASTAAGSLSNYDVGRVGLAFRPVNALLWGLALGWLAAAVRGRRHATS